MIMNIGELRQMKPATMQHLYYDHDKERRFYEFADLNPLDLFLVLDIEPHLNSVRVLRYNGDVGWISGYFDGSRVIAGVA